MAEAEVHTVLVKASIALRKPDDLEHRTAQAKAAWHAIELGRIKEGPSRNFSVRNAA